MPKPRRPYSPARDDEVVASRALPLANGERLLSRAEVADKVGKSFVTIWQMVRAGKFPAPRLVNRSSMWLQSEVDAWMAALPVRPYRPLEGDLDD
jgi:predicted DNA-binding transcriptional regulator AlpA